MMETQVIKELQVLSLKIAKQIKLRKVLLKLKSSPNAKKIIQEKIDELQTQKDLIDNAINIFRNPNFN